MEFITTTTFVIQKSEIFVLYYLYGFVCMFYLGFGFWINWGCWIFIAIFFCKIVDYKWHFDLKWKGVICICISSSTSFFVLWNILKKMNDRSKVNVDVPKSMHCVICYSNPMFFYSSHQRTMLKKTPMSYIKNNGIIALRKNVDVNHGFIANFLKKKWITTWKVQWKEHLQTKGLW